MPEKPRNVPATRATRRYPAWAIELYASIRLMLCWVSAATFPTPIVRMARTQRGAAHSARKGNRGGPSARRIAAKAAAFVPAIMKAVTGVGAPSYTSGNHMWKGTGARGALAEVACAH